jgi:DNA-binding NarL/FixJ family response regulator
MSARRLPYGRRPDVGTVERVDRREGVGSDGVVRVLVVDDQAQFRRAMIAVVEETDGFEVVGQASSGEQALALAAALLPDLVLMDVNLPAIDGLESTRRLRSGGSPPVVLLLSTYDEEAGVQFVAESGAAAYVTKSAFGPDRLEAVWSTAVGRPLA